VTVDDEFEECFREHFPRLVALGVAMSGSREVARDLAQETMVRAHANWAEIRHYDVPWAWLRRVMTNLLIDHHRSRRAEGAAVVRLGARLDGGRSDTGSSGPTTGDWAAMIAPLPPRQRAVVTLFYAEDLSIEQIAEAMHIRTGTVKSALAKARDRLGSTWGAGAAAQDVNGGTR
jgi:RNA polymerase sigma-70 factor (ECF subfamily)